MPLSQPTEFHVSPTLPYENGIHLLGSKAQIYFVENEGMAWGWKLGGNWGKLLLTTFRFVAVFFGIFYIRKIIREKYNRGFIICAGLIFAGALGNLIDSMFYGLIFDASHYNHVAQLFPHEGGYTGFLKGRVVDMLYFPLIKAHYPQWVPMLGGQDFEFFPEIFNIADASISIGVICILLFQKKFFDTKDRGKIPENILDPVSV